jgi:ATP-dependent DNA helicase RecG
MAPPTNDDPLRTPVQFVPGVGPRRAPLLERLGLFVAEDLLFNIPRDVLDLSDVRTVPELVEGETAGVRGVVVDRDARSLPKNRTLVAVLLDCDGHYLSGTWFNQPWRLKQFEPGATLLFSGKPKRRGGRWEISHPHVQVLEGDSEDARGEVLPRYSLTDGLSMSEMRTIARNAVDEYAPYLPEFLPEPYRAAQALPDVRTAVAWLHRPTTMQEFDHGRHRLVYDDLLEFQLALALRRRFWKLGERAPELPSSAKVDARIRRLFPFRFTAGQDRAVAEIARDLASGSAMHRLLQADVGAGKTAVALHAMLVTIAAGHQTVVMAPTEVLAQQHWATIESALAHSRVRRLLLTGRLTKRERTDALARIAAAEVDLVVGTQAVIQADVSFAKLGLAVIDEQHKFGVMQRSTFSKKTAASDVLKPHVLVMTATPIPRSLCLTQYGDLDVTRIDELPPGRQRIVTSRIPSEAAARKAWDFVREKLAVGRQAYIVCPRIEDDPQRTGRLGMGAERVADELARGELADFSVGLVHGRLDSAEKERVVADFRKGAIRVLVSTTVIEVGIDVPNATLMVILHANRFGLSQLHQLRGRIGRGRHQGYCLLFTEPADDATDDANERLAAMERTADGFEIAETDFAIRGPGDVLGTRQSGELPLRVADLVRDAKVLDEARQHAFDLVETGTFDGPDFAPLKVRVLERFGHLMDLPRSG